MPLCRNGKGFYRGTEPSPKGRGYCARHEKIGTKKRGRDKKMWIVRSVKLTTGKRSRRWVRVTSNKPKVKKLKGGRVKSFYIQVPGYDLRKIDVPNPKDPVETTLQVYADVGGCPEFRRITKLRFNDKVVWDRKEKEFTSWTMLEKSIGKHRNIPVLEGSM